MESIKVVFYEDRLKRQMNEVDRIMLDFVKIIISKIHQELF